MLPKFMTHAAPGFDDPIGLLKACHLRIDQRCALLLRVIEHIGKQGVDQQVKQACTQVLHYFNTSAQQHHADEEEDLFPALLRSVTPPQRKRMQALIDTLTADHVEMKKTWEALRANLEAILADKVQTLDAELVDRFQTLYLEHIQREEHDAFAAASNYLSPAELERIGQAMAARRGVAYPDADTIVTQTAESAAPRAESRR
ncbi:MAG TPA: hemerythrin domain-containing protein [Burkholderiales bacterium]|jgi:Hemerythrin HHE cation binding domain.